MAAIAILTAIALICRASAQNTTTTILLPDALFDSWPVSQTFVGEMTVSDHTTYYTLDCGNVNDTNFSPGDGCAGSAGSAGSASNSYTFSADAANTQYILPDIDLGQSPLYNTAPVPTWLEDFNQTVTINCGTLNSNSSALCTTTSLYNKENADDKSIISSTIVTQDTTFIEIAIFPMILTAPGTAAAAASIPFNPTASSTSNRNAIPKPTPSPSSSAAATKPLTPGAKAGIGIGVPLGLLALAGLAFLLHRRFKQRRGPRLSQTEHLMVAQPMSPYDGAGKNGRDNGVVPDVDTSGLYEMEGRRSPVQLGSGELEG